MPTDTVTYRKLSNPLLTLKEVLSRFNMFSSGTSSTRAASGPSFNAVDELFKKHNFLLHHGTIAHNHIIRARAAHRSSGASPIWQTLRRTSYSSGSQNELNYNSVSHSHNFGKRLYLRLMFSRVDLSTWLKLSLKGWGRGK